MPGTSYRIKIHDKYRLELGLELRFIFAILRTRNYYQDFEGQAAQKKWSHMISAEYAFYTYYSYRIIPGRGARAIYFPPES